MQFIQPLLISSLILSGLATTNTVLAEVLPTATVGIKIPLAKKPTSRPMTVAYIPFLKHYYIADGGLAPLASEYEAAVSKSQIHAYDDTGKYVN